MAVKSYRDLEVWQRSRDLALSMYRDTQGFPSDERFGLTSQLRRASVSIAANIAEGQARIHTGDFVRHLSIARVSLAEVETLPEIARGLEYLPRDKTKQLWNDLQTIGRMLTSLIRSLESRRQKTKEGKHQSQATNHQLLENDQSEAAQ